VQSYTTQGGKIANRTLRREKGDLQGSRSQGEGKAGGLGDAKVDILVAKFLRPFVQDGATFYQNGRSIGTKNTKWEAVQERRSRHLQAVSRASNQFGLPLYNTELRLGGTPVQRV